MRLVLVGYGPVAWHLSNPSSPLYHLTTGIGGSAFVELSILEPDAARVLVDRLTAPPLALVWETRADETRGVQELLDRTYRVPWVLQSVCGTLVERLAGAGRGTIRLDDVRRALERVSLMDDLERVDFALLLGVGRRQRDLARAGGLWILRLLVVQRYFAPPRLVDQLGQRLVSSVEASFTLVEAREWLRRDLARADLGGAKRTAIERWLADQDLGRLFHGLALTLVLAEVERDGSKAFWFRDHIYPRERRRLAGRGGRSAEDLVGDARTAFEELIAF